MTMTPTQREAALRLASVPICERSVSWQSDATMLLRELAARDSDIGSTKTMLADAWALGFAAGDEWRSAVVRFWAAHDSDERNEVPRQPANPHKPAPTGPVCNLRTPWIAPDELAEESLPAEPVNPAPGYCKHCKQYTIEEPLPADPVYAAPQRREPLSDAQIEDCIDIANWQFNGGRLGPGVPQQMTTYDDWKYWLARAVERAHGIVEAP